MIKEAYGVKAKPITVRNPQANAIVERVHQVIGNITHTFELKNNYLDDNDPWKGILKGGSTAQMVLFWSCSAHGSASLNISLGTGPFLGLQLKIIWSCSGPVL
jgi:hypothetical protein